MPNALAQAPAPPPANVTVAFDFTEQETVRTPARPPPVCTTWTWSPGCQWPANGTGRPFYGPVQIHIEERYVVGDVMNVSGFVDRLNSTYLHAVTIMVRDPTGNIIAVDQVMPSTNGTFSAQVVAGGQRWTAGGVYEVRVQYGAHRASATFEFFSGGAGGDWVPPPAPPPAPPEPVVVIGGGAAAGGGAPIAVTGVGDEASIVIDVAGLSSSPLDGTAASMVTFPPHETGVVASFAEVSFPPGVTATHVPSDGRLVMRISIATPSDERVQGALAYEGSGRVTLQRVVEVGTGAGRVTFDTPVRIFLEGQGGGRAFYIEGAGGEIMPIDEACAADGVDRVHGQLGGAGECQVDSADGGKVIYTYHLTRFGTARPEHAAPLPTIYTCAVGIGTADLDMRVAPGGYSEPVRQVISNRGTLSFEHVDLVATPWRIENDGGSRTGAEPPPPPAPPVGVTEVLDVDAGGGYMSVVEGPAVAHGLEGGDIAPLLFRLNLTSHGGLQGATMVQNVTYHATCGPT